MRVDSQTGLIIHHGLITRSLFAIRFLQLVNFVFGWVYAVLLGRFALDYFGARRSTGFYQFIERITDPLYRPFEGIVPMGSDDAGHPIVWSILVAIIAVAVVHFAIQRLVRLLARPHVAI
jgi:uncharacterized protein YggT (Ycf19 family)